MIARDAIHRRLDAGDGFQSFGQMLGFLNQIARETNEVRRERIYLPYNRVQIGAVALVVHVSNMDHPVGWVTVAEADLPNLDPGWFQPARVGHRQDWS